MYSLNNLSYSSQAPTYKPSPMRGFGSLAYGSSGSSETSGTQRVCKNTCQSVGVCTCR